MAQEEVIDREQEIQTSLNPARAAGESYADYRARRTAVNQLLKQRLRGAGYHYEMQTYTPAGSDVQKGIPYVKEETQ